MLLMSGHSTFIFHDISVSPLLIEIVALRQTIYVQEVMGSYPEVLQFCCDRMLYKCSSSIFNLIITSEQRPILFQE